MTCPSCGGELVAGAERCPVCDATAVPRVEGALAADPRFVTPPARGKTRVEPLRDIPGLRKKERTWRDEVQDRVRSRRQKRVNAVLPLFEQPEVMDAPAVPEPATSGPEAPVDLWTPPRWTRHLASLLTLPVFILVAAAYVPGTRIKAALGHAMILGVKAWALAHLLSNGRLGDVILFGAFLAWAILDFRAARLRDRQQGTTYPARGFVRDIVVVVVGLAAWAVFAMSLHGTLIGVRPFG